MQAAFPADFSKKAPTGNTGGQLKKELSYVFDDHAAVGLGAGGMGADIVHLLQRSVDKRRNLKRDRVVPDFVYDKMMKRYEQPQLSEGFVMLIRYGLED